MIDIRGRIFNRMRTIRLQLLCTCSTPYMKFVAMVKDIKLGDNCKFWLSTYFRRFPESLIIIGKRCSFRSDKYSNLIGVSKRCIISTHDEKSQIIIGSDCGFSGVTIGCLKRIEIGDRVLVGANTLITDFDWHDVNPDKRRTSAGVPKDVIIENNVFIGYGSVILKGSYIGENSVIGANSVVSGRIPANCIAAGNPAKVVKNLPV